MDRAADLVSPSKREDAGSVLTEPLLFDVSHRSICRNPRRLDALIALALLLLPLLWFAPQALGGKTLLPADNLFAFEPWQHFAAEQGVGTPHNLLISDLILENRPGSR